MCILMPTFCNFEIGKVLRYVVAFSAVSLTLIRNFWVVTETVFRLP